MSARTVLSVVLALLTASCAAPVREETVVVLPGPDGKVGTVVVERCDNGQGDFDNTPGVVAFGALPAGTLTVTQTRAPEGFTPAAPLHVEHGVNPTAVDLFSEAAEAESGAVEMAAFDEETFGPVAAVTRVTTAEEAVELANQSEYGLGASIWSAAPERAAGLARKLEVGHVSVNGIVKSDPRLPFGGVKHSGYGRELGRHGMLEFVNVKTVWIA